MVNAFKKGRKLLKKLADKAAGTRLGKQVMKIPAPIRKGYAAGLMVPIPGAGEVGAIAGTGGKRPNHIRIADCEIRFMSGQSGISLNHSDKVTVENCHVHHYPGWTVGIYVNRTNGFNLLSTHIKNITFERNTFINADPEANWFTGIFVQTGAGAPEGLVARNNILSRLRPPFPGTVEDNIFMHETDPAVAGTGGMVVSDAAALFIDPAKGDYRRKPGGPLMEAGSDVPPPSARWSRQVGFTGP